MRTISLIFEKKHEEEICTMLNSFASEIFTREYDNKKQWNYIFENDGCFYMDCEKYSIVPFDEKLRTEFDNEQAMIIRDNDGITYSIIQEDEATMKILKSMGEFFILSADISGRADSTAEVCLMIEKFLSKIAGFAMDDYSEHLWTYEEVLNRKLFNGHPYFDHNGWQEEYDLYGPYAEFGIVDKIKLLKDYGKYEPEKYNVIKIQDNALDSWYPEIASLNTYFHKLSRSEKGLARVAI